MKDLVQISVLLWLVLSVLTFVIIQMLFKRKWAMDRLRSTRVKWDANKRELHKWEWLNQLQDQLIIVDFPGQLRMFASLSAFLFLLGSYFGWVWFLNVKSVLLMSTGMACIPWLVVRFRLVQLRMKMRVSFLIAVEIFYQAYVSVPRRNIRVVLGKLMKEKRLPKMITPLFRELHEQLVFGDEQALSRFAKSFAHEWGYTFTHFLEIGLSEGAVLDDVFQDFIQDIRDSQKSVMDDRNRLIEVRIANFTPPLFLILFVGVNLYFNYEAAVKAYFYDLHGRMLLLESCLLICASFAMGIVLSMRKT